MENTQKITWVALEYEERERSKDWFWALGVIIVTSSLAAMIYGNYFFAVLIIIAGILLGFFANKKPDMVSYELNDTGLRIGSRLYPYENIKSFWVQISKEGAGELKPTFFIKSERIFMPIISMPIDEALASNIRGVMLQREIEEEEMKDHPSEKILESLGF